jgi:hypothetical protein
MALELTEAAQREAEKINIKPQYVLKIEGVATLFGAVPILKYNQFDDPGLQFDDPGLVFDGLGQIENQDDLIDLEGSSSSINQQLHPDKGSVSSVSSIQVALIDFNNQITELISPGVGELEDILGARCKIYMGFQNTGFPEDYVPIFQGIIDDVESSAGKIVFNIAHPDQKKRQELFQKVEIQLTASIDADDTSLAFTHVDTSRTLYTQGLSRIDYTPDTTFRTFIRIDDEIVEYTTVPTSPVTIIRGALGTTAASHSSGTKGEAFVVLEGDLVDLALKLMLSKRREGYVEDLPATSFNWVESANIQNAIYFSGVDVEEEYGITAGDVVYIYDAINAENIHDDPINPGLKIEEVVKTDLGSYIRIQSYNDFVGDVVFVNENDSTATLTFYSRYDTWPVGLGMKPDEVDVIEHEYWQDSVLSSYEYRFYIKEPINGKDFLEKEIYAPFGAYSVPRKGRASLGFHRGPVPRSEIPVLNKNNIRSPDKIKLRRTINKNFYNTVAYTYDESPLEDKFLSGLAVFNADSAARIEVGNKVLRFDSKGIRSDLLAASLTEQSANRLLGRYKFGAEFIENLQVFFKDGFNIEPGDLVLVDFTDLKVSNTVTGTRNKSSKFFEVINRSMNLRTGDVSLSLIDTNYDASERYGVISPSSVIESGTDTYAYIQDSYGEVFENDEPRKWERYVGLPVLIHNADFSFSEEIVFTGFDPNDRYKMLFSGTLSQPVEAGWIIDIAPYSSSSDPDENRIYKLYHAHFSPLVSVTAGTSEVLFTVGTGDVGKFSVGNVVRVHSVDFSDFSPEVKVSDITGNDITVNAALGFTPDNTHKVSFIGFADGEESYRIV